MKSETRRLKAALAKLARDFDALNWRYREPTAKHDTIRTQLWPGRADEDVVICVYRGKSYNEVFHRQDYFFFNFAYKGDYEAISHRFDNHLTIDEGECYISQPHAGYAIRCQSDEERIIVGVLIRTESFFKTFFQALSSDAHLFRFFLNAQIDTSSDEFLHIHFPDDFTVRRLLELMVVEYATPQENTQATLQPLTLALLMQIARCCTDVAHDATDDTPARQIVAYVTAHADTVTLGGVARHFGYHPNYISTLLPKELGKSFSEIVLEQRMTRALALLRGSPLPVSEVALLVGYTNTSNFHKAFRAYYGHTPRKA